MYIYICMFIFRHVLGKPLLGVSFPKPGEYEIAMFCGGTMGTWLEYTFRFGRLMPFFCFKRVGQLFDIYIYICFFWLYIYIHIYIYIDRKTNVGFPRLVVFHRTVSRDWQWWVIILHDMCLCWSGVISCYFLIWSLISTNVMSWCSLSKWPQSNGPASNLISACLLGTIKHVCNYGFEPALDKH